jgi:hypothetical protein
VTADLTGCARCGQPHLREGKPTCAGHSKRERRRAEAAGEPRDVPCPNWPMKGQRVCRSHGGSAAQNRAAGERRHREEQARAAVVTYGLPREVEPAQALLEEVHRTAGHVTWLGDLVAELERGELAQWSEAAGRRPSIWVELYQTERAHLARVAKSAIDAGIAERQVHLAEQQGELLAVVIRRILDDLALSPEQAARLPDVVPRHLRALTAGGPA